MSGEEERDLNELSLELKSDDEYPLPEERDSEKKEEGRAGEQVSYKDVDVAIRFKKESAEDSITDEKRVLFTDSGFGLEKLLYDEDKEILRVPIVLAKEMIYHYDDYDAFRPKEELEAVASCIKGIPVTRGHPEEMIVTDREEVLGWAIDAEFKDDELRVVLEIADKDLIEDIKKGKLRGVSPGHFSRLDETSSGEYEGAHYDVVQRDIFIDHIAIVEEGRCSVSDGCGIKVDAEVKDKKKEGDEKSVMKGILSKLNTVLKLAEKLEDETLKKKLEELKKAIEEEEEKLKKKSNYPLPGEKGKTGDKKEEQTDEAVSDEAMKKLELERDELKTSLDEIVAKEKEKEGRTDEAVNDEAMKKLKSERDELKASLDEIVAKEKEKEGRTDEAINDEAMKKLKSERDELKTSLDEIVAEEKEKLVGELNSLQDVKSEDKLKDMSLDGLKSDLELVKALRSSKFTVDADGQKNEGGSVAIKSAYESVGKVGGKD